MISQDAEPNARSKSDPVSRASETYRDMGYDLLPALCSASCDITHDTGDTICNGHWVLHLVISYRRQGVRFVTGIGFLHLEISHTRQGVRLVTCIGFCILCYHARDRGHDLFRTHETGGTICYGHWVLHLVISYTRKGVRFVTGTGFCFCDITQETEGTMCYGHCVLHLVPSHRTQGV